MPQAVGSSKILGFCIGAQGPLALECYTHVKIGPAASGLRNVCIITDEELARSGNRQVGDEVNNLRTTTA